MASIIKHFSDITQKWEQCHDRTGRCPYSQHEPDLSVFDKKLDTVKQPTDEEIRKFMGQTIPAPNLQPAQQSASNGNRGSTAVNASVQKIEGHVRESIVEGLIPDARVLGGTIKADIEYIENGKLLRASVKGGSKWQLMLYGKNRLTETATGKNDNDFINGRNADMSGFLTKEIDCFPEDWKTYEKDKSTVKEMLKTHTQEQIATKLGNTNEYINSKIKLQKVTEEFASNLSDKKNLRKFLEKAMFDNDSCQKFIVVKNHKIYTFDKEYVLNTLTDAFTPETSNAGRRKDDYNVDGQKVVLKADFKSRPSKAHPEGKTVSNNVLEVEIRNDSAQHYREVRLNLLGAKAFTLLSKTQADGSKPYTVIDIPERLHSNATK